ncbi:sensor histidine kinase [Calothrix rhizosoleniae]|uniref:sensor histidine kinase n=1 Tax=Calothrix rhizosoleniae TaxID=888997 RepID=UPI000B4A07E7|nr:HAMP domain-containing sensor histidine kinase [Calothrix rhizosoleniae]
MYKWILPSLKEVVTTNQSTFVECSSAKAQQQWRMSLAAAEQMLLSNVENTNHNSIPGLVFTGPVPVFSQPQLAHQIQTITFTGKPFNPLALMPFQMPTVDVNPDLKVNPQESVLPLLPVDPLAQEQFCLIFTGKFRLLLVLTPEENGSRHYLFSFEPEVVQQAWQALGARVMLTNPNLFADLELLVQQYPQAQPDYRQVVQFSQLLLTYIPEPEVKTETVAKGQNEKGNSSLPDSGLDEQDTISNGVENSHSYTQRNDVELLQAFAHEVRTPLTTIRTMTRLLLRQKDLSANVIKRLKIIDCECTEQIDRMELLFQAAELETSPVGKTTTKTPLTAMSLDQVLQQNIPRWQETASRRNLTLEVVLPQQLPTVISNPVMLDRVLTGVMENVTRNLPSGSHIQVQVIPAGNQLKLQLLPLPQSQEPDRKSAFSCTPPIRKALGQLLTFQPETGTISLNLSATKHLFQEIGGKLIVRQRPRHGEILTIFLPLEIQDKQPLGAKN